MPIKQVVLVLSTSQAALLLKGLHFARVGYDEIAMRMIRASKLEQATEAIDVAVLLGTMAATIDAALLDNATVLPIEKDN